MCVQPPGNTCKKTAETKGQKLVTGRVDARGPHGQLIFSDGVENDTGIRVGYLPHDRAQAEHERHGNVVIGEAGPGKAIQTGDPQLTPGYIGNGKDNTFQDNREGQRGEGQVSALEPETGKPYHQARQNRGQCSHGDTAPRRDVGMQIQQGGSIGPHSKEKGVPKIHLTGKTGQEIPTGGQDGENVGQNQDAQQVRVLCNNRQKEQNQKEKKDDNPAGEYEYFSSENGVKLVEPFDIWNFNKSMKLQQSKSPMGIIKAWSYRPGFLLDFC